MHGKYATNLQYFYEFPTLLLQNENESSIALLDSRFSYTEIQR